jgi:hypothetical protein
MRGWEEANDRKKPKVRKANSEDEDLRSWVIRTFPTSQLLTFVF